MKTVDRSVQSKRKQTYKFKGMNSRRSNLPVLASCSSSSGATPNKTLLYFAMPCCDNDNLGEPPESRPDYTDWYCINPKQSPSQPGERLSRLSRMVSVSNKGPEFLSGIVLGSDIHCFTGTSPETGYNIPSLLSTYSTVTNEWSCDIPLPKATRLYPFLLTCGGFIFAIGCRVSPPSSVCPWAECYNPIRKQWISLPDLPVEFDPVFDFDATSVVLDDARFLISINRYRCFLMFDISSWVWTTIHRPHFPLPDCNFDPKMVVVGKRIYMFFRCRMYAYNFQRGGDSMEEVYFRDRMPSSISRIYGDIFQIHLGGKDFCFVWSCISNPDPAVNTSMVYCVHFKVKRVTDYEGRKRREAFIKGCYSYTVRGGPIRECLAVPS